MIEKRQRRKMQVATLHNNLKSPANVNGTIASPWRAKIHRIGLLNITWTIKYVIIK